MPYWVGGSGNITDAANHWAATSGGAPGAGNLPSSTTDAIFDVLSNITAYTVTVDATFTCRDLLFNAAPAAGTITLGGASGVLNVHGSLLMLAGMSCTALNTIKFAATTTGATAPATM